MHLDDHSECEGAHAILAPSSPYWLNYDKDKLRRYVGSHYASAIGDSCHKFAQNRIANRLVLGTRKSELNAEKNGLLAWILNDGIPRYAIDVDFLYPTVAAFVNDSISNLMDPEQRLYYSWECFGHADACGFRRSVLRINDLKTGVTPAHIEQLVIYAALYCLETETDPMSIRTILKIFQNGEISEYEPSGEELKRCMDVISDDVDFLQRLKKGEI